MAPPGPHELLPDGFHAIDLAAEVQIRYRRDRERTARGQRQLETGADHPIRLPSRPRRNGVVGVQAQIRFGDMYSRL